jgi:hypothetical protein
LIEDLWGYFKKSALNNYFYGEIASLESVVEEGPQELQLHPEFAISLAYKSYKDLCKNV